MVKGQFSGIYNISNEPLYFMGFDNELKIYNDPLLILATDPNNKNTYGRYSQEYINERIKAQKERGWEHEKRNIYQVNEE